MKKLFILFVLMLPLWGLGGFVFAQSTDLVPDGIVVSRLTVTQRDAIVSPSIGQLIYNTNEGCFNIYSLPNTWQSLCAFGSTNLTQQGNNFNQANQLVKLDAARNLAISGSILTEPYINVTQFSNNWVNCGFPYATAAYYKDKNSIVHLRGCIKDGIPNNQDLFVLPVGYRPKYTIVFDVVKSNFLGVISIDFNGSVKSITGSSNNSYLSLDGISFMAE